MVVLEVVQAKSLKSVAVNIVKALVTILQKPNTDFRQKYFNVKKFLISLI